MGARYQGARPGGYEPSRIGIGQGLDGPSVLSHGPDRPQAYQILEAVSARVVSSASFNCERNSRNGSAMRVCVARPRHGRQVGTPLPRPEERGATDPLVMVIISPRGSARVAVSLRSAWSMLRRLRAGPGGPMGRRGMLAKAGRGAPREQR